MILVVLENILLFGLLACVVLSLAIHFRPNSTLSKSSKKLFQGRIKNLSTLNKRRILEVEELSAIEKDIAGLESVVLIANLAEAPSDSSLAPAVIDNFKEGVRYSFFVSAYRKTSSEDQDKLYQAFRALYDFALQTAAEEGRHSKIKSVPFEDLFHIYFLPTDWNNVPYLFYTFICDELKPKTLAFKGSMRGVGISSRYSRVVPTEASALIELCSAASEEFRPIFGDKNIDIVRNIPSSHVVPFRLDSRIAGP